MNKVRNILKQVCQLEGLAEKRGCQLVKARGENGRNEIDSIEYEEDYVIVSVREDTRHDCPDYYSAKLTIEELEASEEEWNSNIQYVIANRLEKERRSKEAREKRILEEKKQQLKDLKKELRGK